jgi:hypothetical protein
MLAGSQEGAQHMKVQVMRYVLLAALAGGGSAYAQETQPPAQQPSGRASTMTGSQSIFCGTMHTGQLCSFGTSNVLGVTGETQQQWLQAARRYNRAVEAATQQLFKDAEGTLTAEQMDLLKAWFAVGLNPEINKLLYSKGLGKKQ